MVVDTWAAAQEAEEGAKHGDEEEVEAEEIKLRMQRKRRKRFYS